MDEQNTQRRIQHHNNRERADNGDGELKAKMGKLDERMEKWKRVKNRNLHERLKNGDPEACILQWDSIATPASCEMLQFACGQSNPGNGPLMCPTANILAD
jgi:hypothetical protein